MNHKSSETMGYREHERFSNGDWIGVLEKMELGDHLCFIYQTEEEHRNLLTHFLRIGLERNEKIIYIVDNHTNETIIEYLRGTVNINAFIDAGQFVILDCDRSYVREGIFDPEKMIALLKAETETALAEGYSGLRVTGEMSWALHGKPGSDRLIEDEIKLNNFFPESKSIALCQYDQKRFPPEILMDVLRTHPIVIIGTEIYDNFYYIPPEILLSKNGKAKEFQCLVKSLEKHKQAEEIIRESEHYYRELFESAHDAIIIFSPEEEIVLDVNQRACEVYGFSRAEFIGMSLKEISKNIPRGKKHIEKTLEKGYFHHFETVEYRKDGTEIFLEINASVINYKGQQAILSLNRDITERKAAEKALKESEKNFRMIFQNAGYGIATADENGNITNANPKFSDMLGYSLKELLGKNFSEITLPQYHDYEFRQVERIIRGEINDYSFEKQYLTKNGDSIWVYVSVTANKDEQENIIGYIGTVTDISERKKAEQETKRIKEFYELILETVHDGIWVTDKNDVIYYVNSALAKIAGVPKEQILNRNVFDDFPQETIGEFIVYYKRAKDTLTPMEYEATVITPSDKETIQQGWLLPLLKDGKYNGIICSIHDITKRKQAEKELIIKDNAFRSSISAIAISDLEGYLTYVNPAFLEMWGYSTKNDVLGKLSTEFWESPEEALQIIQQLKQKGQYFGELIGKRKDGSLFDAQIAAAIILGSDEYVLGFIASFIDITERKQAEEALKTSERKLREANATKDKFFSIISHDLKSGYNVILTGTSLLQRTNFAEKEINQTISTLYKTAENQFELLENLLTWSRLQRNKITCNPSSMDISNLTKYVVYLTKPVAENKELTLDSHMEGEIMVYADHNMIETVIRNLISNAIKFTNPGGKIEISIEERDGFAEVSVSDTGVGIETEDLSGLFCIDSDRQTRGTQGEKGTGLGLILCKEFIEKNNGKIWAESEIGEGSTFRFVLPKKPADSAEAEL